MLLVSWINLLKYFIVDIVHLKFILKLILQNTGLSVLLYLFFFFYLRLCINIIGLSLYIPNYLRNTKVTDLNNIH